MAFYFSSKMDDEKFISVRNFALRRQVQDPLDDTRTFSLWRSVFQLYPFVQGTLHSEIDFWEQDYHFAVEFHRDLLSVSAIHFLISVTWITISNFCGIAKPISVIPL